MIQRIQSVFMFLAAVAAALLFVFPYAYSLGENAQPLMMADYLTLLILTCAIIAINLIGIMLFKNRKFQVNLNRLSILLSLALASILLYEYFLGDDYNIRVMQLGQFIPVLIILFNALAISRIKKDDKLVRSMDRLR